MNCPSCQNRINPKRHQFCPKCGGAIVLVNGQPVLPPPPSALETTKKVAVTVAEGSKKVAVHGKTLVEWVLENWLGIVIALLILGFVIKQFKAFIIDIMQ